MPGVTLLFSKGLDLKVCDSMDFISTLCNEFPVLKLGDIS